MFTTLLQRRDRKHITSTNPRRPRGRCCLLQLETLEDRTMPSVIFPGIASAVDGVLAAIQTDVGSALSAARSIPVVGQQLGDFGAANEIASLRTQLTNAFASIPDA